ncbi:TPA: hypothetical protein HA338_11030 [Methanosarcina acetivorans]|nr:hypothetical protein [Methanosarcina acetivorans]
MASPPSTRYIGNESVWIFPTAPPKESMSSIEKKKYGLIEIPVSDFEKHAYDLGLPTAIVSEHIKLGEPLYVITNPDIKIESCKFEGKKTITKDEEDTSYSMDREF